MTIVTKNKRYSLRPKVARAIKKAAVTTAKVILSIAISVVVLGGLAYGLAEEALERREYWNEVASR